MKKENKVIILAIAFLALSGYAFALDWKLLHENADRISPQEAALDLSNSPNSIDKLYVMGLIYLNKYQDDKAENAFKEIVSIDNKNIEAKWGIAEVLRRAHRLEESESLLNEVIEQDSSFSPAYISLAYIKYLQMDFAGMAKLTAKVINQNREKVDLPNYVRAHSLYAGAKGMLAHYGGMFSKAINAAAVIRHLNIARDLDSDSPAVNYGYGSYYLLIPKVFGRDLDKAIKYFQKAIESDPFFVEAYIRLAQSFKLRKEEDKFDKYLNKALELDPKNELANDIKSGECRFICPK